MKIVCDKNMPYAAEAFGTLGDVLVKDGRAITAEDVRDADLLITRSTTKINAALLDGSRVRFYGSAVIGMDHIDIPYLNARHIPWVSAPGCNAESVANYVTAALLWLGGKFGFTLAGKTVGIVGVGNVGGKVFRHLSALGMRVLACDPPRQRNAADKGARGFVPFETVLEEADVITCHVPLTRTGPDATYHMIDAAALAKMKPGVVFVNAARGPVVDTDAFIAAKESGRVSRAVIDCWEGEPAFRADMLAHAELSTPHIAGYAFEGKVNGTIMTYRAACKFLGVEPTYAFTLPLPPIPEWRSDAGGRADEDVIRELVLAVCDIEGDSNRLRAACVADDSARAKAFDSQRGHYPMRRQFDATQVCVGHASPGLLAKLHGLGFQIG
jgi:erythronate-4-phosphate dehydrogenase